MDGPGGNRQIITLLAPEMYRSFFFFLQNLNLYPAVRTTRRRGGHLSYVLCSYMYGIDVFDQARLVGAR